MFPFKVIVCKVTEFSTLMAALFNKHFQFPQQAEQYEGMVADNEPIVAPQGTAEMELRAKQLVKLLEGLELHMIHELQKKVAREHSLVLAERAREEGTLPTDVWKKPVRHIFLIFSKLLGIK